MEQILRKFQKTVILGQNGHFSAHLAKIGQNEKFYQKSGRAIFLPLLSPNFMPSFRKIGGAVSEINSLLTNIHTSIHPYKGETIEPVAFAGSIFRPPKVTLNERVTLRLNGVTIFESPKIKYLGIILDSRLTWKHHVNEICKKLGRSLGMIYKTRKLCNENILRSLYFSLFNSHASYGLAVWGQCQSEIFSKIERLQKRIIRAIKFADFNAPSKPLMKELQILSIKDLYSTKIASLMWDFDHGLLPHSLSSLFTRRSFYIILI